MNTSTTSSCQTGRTLSAGRRWPARCARLILAALACLPCSASEIALTFVTVGEPGNPPNSRTYGSGGAVPYSYSIGKSPVTNAQFALFLDAVADDDLHGLYSPEMKIRRSGRPGAFSYTPLPGWEKHPVTFVAGIDAIRFCNWLHNGMPIGPQGHATTEAGAYLIHGKNIPGKRELRARFFLPTYDEWVKAAFHDPTREAAIPYRYFATGSDEEPIRGNPSHLPGRVNGAQVIGGTTPIDAYPNTQTYWGALDMEGNVINWCEPDSNESRQRYIGVAFWGLSDPTGVGGAYTNNSQREAGLGFRVAAIAPISEEVTWGSLRPVAQPTGKRHAKDSAETARAAPVGKLPVEEGFPEPAPEPPPTTESLDKVRECIARYSAGKAAIEAGREATLAVIRKEQAAGRLSSDDARQLELNINPVSAKNGNSPQFLRTAIRLAAPHPALVAAVAELDAASIPLIGQRKDFLKQCSKALSEMSAHAFREKLTPEEIARRLALIEESMTIDCPETYVLGLTAHRTALGALKTLAELAPPRSPDDHARMTAAFAVLRKVSQEASDGYLRKEALQLCLQRHYAPYAREAARCRNDLDLAIANGKPAGELRSLFTNWLHATIQRDALDQHPIKQLENGRIADAYRAVIETMAATTESRGRTANNIQALRDAVISQSVELGPTRAAVFLPILNRAAASMAKKVPDQPRPELAALHQQLAGIRDPAALIVVAQGLSRNSDPHQDRAAAAPDSLSTLRKTLLSLAEAWQDANVETLRTIRHTVSSRGDAFYPSLQAILARAERDILADYLVLPDLTNGPLAAMDPETAMETFCDRLAARGEWRTLLLFLEARIRNGPRWPDPGWTDSVIAIKSYMLGQNHERAGLNAEAATCYRQTLQSLASRGPLREAAARWQALHGVARPQGHPTAERP